MSCVDETKSALSALAVKELLKRNINCLGIGSGTTIQHFIEALTNSNQEFEVIPTSVDTEIRVSTKQFCRKIESIVISPELAIDGADEVEISSGYLLKGGGGALTREKIVAYSAEEFWVLIDSSKLVNKLGTLHSIPIEVLPFGWKRTNQCIEQLKGSCQIRKGTGKVGPVITDNGNYILDFQPKGNWNPKEMENKINQIPGVVENGIFVRSPNKVIVGKGKTTEIMIY